MWSSQIEPSGDGRTRRVAVQQDAAPISYGEVLAEWQSSAAFRTFFAALLADAPYDAFLWETPPVSRATLAQPFECVLVESPALAAMTPEPEAFATHYRRSEPVATFANLGGDAWLVAPAPQGPAAAYAHLAAFCRQAADAQHHALWQAVGIAVAAHLSDAPLWLSTSGLGIAWLHVRLDKRPKYYAYGPYRRAG
jgi:hypothetical protein